MRSLTDPENDPPMAPADWGGAKEAEEAEEVKEGWPPTSIPLVIATLIMTPGHTVVFLAVHGPTRARSVTNSQAQTEEKEG